MKFKSPIAAILVILLALHLRADTTEILHPVNQSPSTQPISHKLAYRLSKGSEKWDPIIRAKIIKAMDAAVAIYNENGDFNQTVTANYNPGTPTADANYNGWINFGGQIGTRTALHEIAHTMGVGTHPKWRSLVKDGKFTGQHAIDQLHEFDGPDAVLHADRQHFWPYGLNYEKEGGDENSKRHVKMVVAIRRDLGIKTPE